MAPLLNIDEVLQFAVRIEEQGEQFYRQRAASATGQAAALFTQLADDERQHRGVFSTMLGRLASYQPPTAYPDEYFQYLRAYADQTIFSDAAQKSLPPAASLGDVIEFALGRELASITYYSEMRAFLPPAHHEAIEQVIAEERRHFARLAALKRTL